MVFRIGLRNLVFNFFWSFSNFPKESPFGITDWRLHTHWLVVSLERVNELLMISCVFFTFRCSTSLIAKLRSDVSNFFSIVVFLTNIIKILFNHINKCVVILFIDSWVFEFNNTKFVETLSNFIALFLPTFFFLHVYISINNWNLV